VGVQGRQEGEELREGVRWDGVALQIGELSTLC
jgi:hypothetical protein